MKIYRADVTILPKDGVLDIQGKAVENSLHNYQIGRASCRERV